MKKINQLLLMILLVCTSPLRADESLPPPFEASFKIFRKGVEVAEMHRNLTQIDNGSYVYRSETNSTGLASIFYKLHILEESHWSQQDQQLKPLEYSYDRIKKKKKNHKKTIFDWKNNRANYIGDGKESTFELQAGMTDKLLYQINLMQALKRGEQPDSYTVVDGEKIKTYDFKYLGEEFVDTPIGKFNTLKLVRQKPGKKESITLWCANKLHYLPIKVENKDDDGSVTTAIIDNLAGLPQTQEAYSPTKRSD